MLKRSNWIEAKEEGGWNCTLIVNFYQLWRIGPTHGKVWSVKQPGKEDENALSLHCPGCHSPGGWPRWPGGDWKGEQSDGDGGGDGGGGGHGDDGFNGDGGGGNGDDGGYDCDDDKDKIYMVNNEEESECIEDFCLESGYRSWQYSKQNNR